jgi:DNA-binding SARP family transcriptional activator
MLYLRTLGESVIEVGDIHLGPNAAHPFAVLLYLAFERGRRVPRAQLQELLYPHADDRAGSHSLRQLLYRVRKAGAQSDRVRRRERQVARRPRKG